MFTSDLNKCREFNFFSGFFLVLCDIVGVVGGRLRRGVIFFLIEPSGIEWRVT